MRDDVHMSDATKNGRRSSTPSEKGVIANLPRTRPQRSSPRRAAARQVIKHATASEGDGTGAEVGQPKPTTATAQAGKPKAGAGRPGRAAKDPRVSAPRKDAAPRKDSVPTQGFEAESDIGSGSVQPPGAPELLASVTEILGELAKAGLSTGERLVKDVLSRLPGS
jgi:hypothetical protein